MIDTKIPINVIFNWPAPHPKPVAIIKNRKIPEEFEDFYLSVHERISSIDEKYKCKQVVKSKKIIKYVYGC